MTETTERPVKIADTRYFAARARREQTLVNVEAGMPVRQAWSEAGMSENGYKKARNQHPDWAARLDVLVHGGHKLKNFDGSHAEFNLQYFNHKMAWFQLLYLEELARMPPGNILVAIFPPEHGKTTMFEDYVNETLAIDPEHRFVMACASQGLARKMLGRIKSRMEPMGPTPKYVRDFGPFEPQFGVGHSGSQPWGADYFDVYKKRHSDERDYSVQALGVTSEIIGSRCSHLHVDDPQSTKTLGKVKGRRDDTLKTEDIAQWFHQDALSRPGEYGKTTVNGTIVGHGGFLQYLQRQQHMIDAGIMKVIKFPAIVNNPTTGKPEPLWKERYTMEQLERVKIKSTEPVWNTQYMMTPEANDKSMRNTFTGLVDRCLDGQISFDDPPTEGSICYVMVDPALGTKNVTMGIEIRPDAKFIVRYISDRERFNTNEEIMVEIRTAVTWMQQSGARVTDVIIEAKNFQLGLARDSRLIALSNEFGFMLREHLTGINKYDADIGVPSMASSFILKQIVIPYKDDHASGGSTRFKADELKRQLHAWIPGARGTELVQDQVMALWFGWILWEQRWKQDDGSQTDPDVWRRTGLTYASSLGAALTLPTNWRP